MAAGPCDSTSTATINQIISEINVSSNVYPDEESIDRSVDNILRDIAETGFLSLDWKVYLIPFIALKIHQQFSHYLQEFGFSSATFDSYENRRVEIFELLQSLEYPPFTVQRLAELILNPGISYKSTHKFMNGVLKLLSVTSSHQQ